MRTPPADVDEAELLAVLRGRWLLDVDTVAYAPVGFGSQHWTASSRDGQRWFVTVDALAPAGSAAFTELAAALRCAGALHDRGMAVVAPLRASGGAVLERVGAHHLVAVSSLGQRGFRSSAAGCVRSGTLAAPCVGRCAAPG